MIKFVVVWDNGASARGTFPYEFDTCEEAHAFGRDWAYECDVTDFGNPDPCEGGYTYDVFEVSLLKGGEAKCVRLHSAPRFQEEGHYVWEVRKV